MADRIEKHDGQGLTKSDFHDIYVLQIGRGYRSKLLGEKRSSRMQFSRTLETNVQNSQKIANQPQRADGFVARKFLFCTVSETKKKTGRVLTKKMISKSFFNGKNELIY
jgi:hypothetical protein